MNKKKKIRVAVICGGPSSERDVSLKSGEQIARNLPADKYLISRIEISKDGQWLLEPQRKMNQLMAEKGKKIPTKALVLKSELLPLTRERFNEFDVAFIGMHGKFGEDGKVQALLEILGIPYTGSGVLASALAMNKIKTIEMAENAGITVPKSLIVRSANASSKATQAEIEKIIGYPCVVKPNESGSSIGTSIVKSKKYLPLALKRAASEDALILIQKYIKGRELTCAVLGNTNQTELIALPIVEIIPKGRTFFDYEAKYSPETREICPALIPNAVTRKIQELSKKAHALLGCDGLTRSDFILVPNGAIYFLEINTIPGLTENSLSPKEARAAGLSFSEFLDTQVQLALKKHKAL